MEEKLEARLRWFGHVQRRKNRSKWKAVELIYKIYAVDKYI